jgi:hypothetical protein
MRKLVVFLILLAIVLVILDRVAVAGAQREIARQVAAKYNLDTPPVVEVKGIPFLTQAISGHYQEIAISMGPMTREGVRLSSIQGRLLGVNAQLNDLLASKSNITADRVIGTVVISRQTVAERAPDGIKVQGNGNDTLSVSGNVVMRNIKIPVTADMRLEVVTGGIRLTPVNVKVAGGITVPTASRFITWTVPVKNLPLNLKITKVRSTADGLAVEGTATDVPLKG